MKHAHHLSSVQFGERYLQLVALGIGLAGLAWALEAAQFFLPSGYANILNWVTLGLGILTVAIVAPSFIRLKLLRSRRACEVRDGFIGSVFRQSAANSFTFAIVAMIVLKVLAQVWLTNITPDVLLEMLFGAIAVFFAAAFFIAIGSETEVITQPGDGQS